MLVSDSVIVLIELLSVVVYNALYAVVYPLAVLIYNLSSNACTMCSLSVVYVWFTGSIPLYSTHGVS